MKHSIFVLAVMALVLTACGGGQAPAATNTNLPAATNTSVPPTAVPPTNTPEPTVDLTATADAEQAAAMAQLKAAIEPDLILAGYSLDNGDLGWLQNPQPFTLTNNVPSQLQVQDLDPTYVGTNFVMGADITWDSTTGVAACGLIFRSQGNDITKGEQAMLWTIRLSGFPGWDFELWKFGQYQANLTGSVRTSSSMHQQAGSTNHYVISANATTITAYANGERMGSTDLKASMSSGHFGVFSWEDSGTTTCTYENIWIWELP